MNIIDCFWEVKNLNRKTIEICLCKDDVFDSNEINNITTGYEYIVAKVPQGKMDYIYGLQNIGFKYIESQIKLSKKYKDFNFNDKLLKLISYKTNFKIIETQEELFSVINSMTEGMFSTDRISLDIEFGPKFSLLRYKNWILDEYSKGTSKIAYIIYDGVKVGFIMFRINKNNIQGMLGGIYEEYQDVGLGILTPSAIFMLCKKFEFNVIKGYTSISSNNQPVLQLYNYFNFKVDNLQYVFVKHQ